MAAASPSKSRLNSLVILKWARIEAACRSMRLFLCLVSMGCTDGRLLHALQVFDLASLLQAISPSTSLFLHKQLLAASSCLVRYLQRKATLDDLIDMYLCTHA